MYYRTDALPPLHTVQVGQEKERWAKVVGLVLPTDSDGRILLARLTYGPEVWAMVGGVAEPGESPDEAARREALEEAGLTITTDRLVAVCDRGQVILFIFAGTVVGGTLCPQVEEIAELRWFTPDEIDSAPVYEVISRLAAEVTSPHGKTLSRRTPARPAPTGPSSDATSRPPAAGRSPALWPQATPHPQGHGAARFGWWQTRRTCGGWRRDR